MTLEEAARIQHALDVAEDNKTRLDTLEKRMDANAEMLASIARLDQRQKDMDRKQEDMDSDIKEIKSDVKGIVSKPGKRWDMLIDKGLTIILTAFLTYLLTNAGF